VYLLFNKRLLKAQLMNR
jgi:cytochrome P450